MQAGQINAAQALMSFMAGEKDKISRKVASHDFAQVLDRQHLKNSAKEGGLQASVGRGVHKSSSDSNSARRTDARDEDDDEQHRRRVSLRNQSKALQPKVSSELYFTNPPLLESTLGQLGVNADVRQACEAAKDDQGRISMKSLLEILSKAGNGSQGTSSGGVPAGTIGELMVSLQQAQGQNTSGFDLKSLGAKSSGTFTFDEFHQLLDNVVGQASEKVASDNALSPFAKTGDPALGSAGTASASSESESPAQQIMGSTIPAFASSNRSAQGSTSPESRTQETQTSVGDAQASQRAVDNLSSGFYGSDPREQGKQASAEDSLSSWEALGTVSEKPAVEFSKFGSNAVHTHAGGEKGSSPANPAEPTGVYANPGLHTEGSQSLRENGISVTAQAGDGFQSQIPDLSSLTNSQSFIVLTEKGTTASQGYAWEHDNGVDSVALSRLQADTDGLKAGSAQGGENSSLLDSDGESEKRGGQNGLAGFFGSIDAEGLEGSHSGNYLRGVTDGFGILMRGAQDSGTAAEGRLQVRGSSWVQDLSQQIKGMSSQNRSHLTLELDPKSLGHITLRIEANNDQVTAVISAGNDQVKDLLIKNSPELRQHLQDAGLNLSQLQVDVRQDAGDGQAAARQARSDTPAGRRGKTAKVQGIEDKMQPESLPAYGRYAEDRLISLFA